MAAERFREAVRGLPHDRRESAEREFSSVGLDCYACHGNVPEDHATRKGTTLQSRTRANADDEVIAICANCHRIHGPPE